MNFKNFHNRSLLIAGVVAVATLLVPGIPAAAQPSDPATSATATATSITGRMTPDCAGLSDTARAYIIANHVQICGYNTASTKPGQIVPLNTVTGTCGSSTILLNLIGGGRTLSVNYGFYSSLGNAAFRALSINLGSTGGGVGSFSDVSPMFNYVYSSARLQAFPRGTALASLTGTITLVWGLTCYMDGPTASRFVS